jgi:hypothetical protein
MTYDKQKNCNVKAAGIIDYDPAQTVSSPVAQGYFRL